MGLIIIVKTIYNDIPGLMTYNQKSTDKTLDMLV